GLAHSEAAHHFETPHVRAHQEGSLPRCELRKHQRLALDCNVEAPVLLVDEINAIVDAGGEIQHLAKSVPGAWFPTQRELEVAARISPRVRPEQEKVRRDE